MTEETGAVEAQADAVVEAPALAEQPSQSTGEALKRALERVTQREAPEVEEDQEKAPDAAPERPRGPDGKFIAKEPVEEPVQTEVPKVEEPKDAAPDRFSPDAKAEWAKASPAIRGEVLRMQRELEGGIEKYRQQLEPMREFFEIARRSNIEPAVAVNTFLQHDAALQRDIVSGLEGVARAYGTDLRTIAAKVMGQPEPAKDETIARLEGHIRQLEQQLGGVTKTVQSQQERSTVEYVKQFAAQRPRFDELAKAPQHNIASFIQRGYSLEEAYEMADRLNPAPQPVEPAPQAETPTPPAPQTRKAELSVQGAPGSNPVAARSASNSEALHRALQRAGVRY